MRLLVASLALLCATGCIQSPVRLAPLPDSDGQAAVRIETLPADPDATTVQRALDGLVDGHVAGARRVLRTDEVLAELARRRRMNDGWLWADIGVSIFGLAANAGSAGDRGNDIALLLPAFLLPIAVVERNSNDRSLGQRMDRCREVARDGDAAINAYASDARGRSRTVPPPGQERDRLVDAIETSGRALADAVRSLMERCS